MNMIQISGNSNFIFFCKKEKAYFNYSPRNRPAFFLFAGLFGIAAFGMLTIDLNSKPPAKKLTSDVISLLKNAELDVLLVVSLISGTKV